VPLRVPQSISLHDRACALVAVDGFPQGMSRLVFSEHQSTEHGPSQVGTSGGPHSDNVTGRIRRELDSAGRGGEPRSALLFDGSAALLGLGRGLRRAQLEHSHDHVRVEGLLLFDRTLEPKDGLLRFDRTRPGHGLTLRTEAAEQFRVPGVRSHQPALQPTLPRHRPRDRPARTVRTRP
jgi:hypothetical protein